MSTVSERVRAACLGLEEPFTFAQIRDAVGARRSDDYLRNAVNHLVQVGDLTRLTDPQSRKCAQTFRRSAEFRAPPAALAKQQASRAIAAAELSRVAQAWGTRGHGHQG